MRPSWSRSGHKFGHKFGFPGFEIPAPVADAWQCASMDSEVVPDLVRLRREQLGLTQIDAAYRAGISRRTWSDIELGHRRGSDTTLAKMDQALDQPVGSLRALAAAEPDSARLAVIRKELIGMIRQLLTEEELESARLGLLRHRYDALEAEVRKRAAR